MNGKILKNKFHYRVKQVLPQLNYSVYYDDDIILIQKIVLL